MLSLVSTTIRSYLGYEFFRLIFTELPKEIQVCILVVNPIISFWIFILQSKKDASGLLQGVRITNWDYSKVVEQAGDDIFIFLDPPYMSTEEAELYGAKGKYHVDFNHTDFYNKVKDTKHKCLITYDKCQGIEEIYKVADKVGWNIKEWTLQYGTNVKRRDMKEKKAARKGIELFIWKNYTLLDQQNISLKASRPHILNGVLS